MKKTIEFGFEVFNNESNETIYSGSKEVEVSEQEIKEVAKIMQEHRGFAVDMCELSTLYDKVWEECMMYYQNKCADPKADLDWDDMTLELQENMPKGLIKAAEPFITVKVVDVCYYYMNEGREEKITVVTWIPSDVFWAMVDVVKTGRRDKPDFDLLKEVNEVAYHNVIYCSLEVACKRMKGKHAVNDVPYLKEFPFEVYENV
jgi:hypothetical protein